MEVIAFAILCLVLGTPFLVAGFIVLVVVISVGMFVVAALATGTEWLHMKLSGSEIYKPTPVVEYPNDSWVSSQPEEVRCVAFHSVAYDVVKREKVQ